MDDVICIKNQEIDVEILNNLKDSFYENTQLINETKQNFLELKIT